MQRLTFERSRGKNVGLALLGSGLVAASWFTIQRAEDSIDRAFGWFGVIFLGSASLWRRNAHLKVALPSCLMAPASGRRTKLASFHGPMSRVASSSPCGAHVCFHSRFANPRRFLPACRRQNEDWLPSTKGWAGGSGRFRLQASTLESTRPCDSSGETPRTFRYRSPDSTSQDGTQWLDAAPAFEPRRVSPGVRYSLA